jgi:hypothetical protein
MKDIDAATLKAMTTNNISSEAIAKEIKRDIRPDMDLGPAKDMLSSSLSFRKLSTVAEEDEDSLGSRKQSRIAVRKRSLIHSMPNRRHETLFRLINSFSSE